MFVCVDSQMYQTQIFCHLFHVSFSAPPPPITKGQLSTQASRCGAQASKSKHFEAFHLPGVPKLRRINIPFALNFHQLLTPVQSIVQSHSPQMGLFSLHPVKFVFFNTWGQKIYFNKSLRNLFANLLTIIAYPSYIISHRENSVKLLISIRNFNYRVNILHQATILLARILNGNGPKDECGGA